MFGAPKIKINKDLLERSKKCAEVAGYPSVEEFIEHVLETELKKIEAGGTSDDAITESLKGLGYIS